MGKGYAATYLRDLVAVLDGSKPAMMMAERSVRRLPERSMDSTGSSPRNFLISRGWPSTLQEWSRNKHLEVSRAADAFAKREHKTTFKRDKDWCKERAFVAAHLSSVRALFSFRPSAICLAPSAPIPFLKRLQARPKSTRQGLLTLVRENSMRQRTAAW